MTHSKALEESVARLKRDMNDRADSRFGNPQLRPALCFDIRTVLEALEQRDQYAAMLAEAEGALKALVLNLSEGDFISTSRIDRANATLAKIAAMKGKEPATLSASSLAKGRLAEARASFEKIVHLILDPKLDAENARALIRVEASKGLKVTE